MSCAWKLTYEVMLNDHSEMCQLSKCINAGLYITRVIINIGFFNQVLNNIITCHLFLTIIVVVVIYLFLLKSWDGRKIPAFCFLSTCKSNIPSVSTMVWASFFAFSITLAISSLVGSTYCVCKLHVWLFLCLWVFILVYLIPVLAKSDSRHTAQDKKVVVSYL